MAGNVDGVDDWYDIVRHSDGKVACKFKLIAGDRVLVNADGIDVVFKRLRPDERVISHETLVEIVTELSARN